MRPVLAAETVTASDALAELAPAWDALAVAAGRPMSSPAWMLGQWRHLRPPGAELRVVTVRDDGELIAIAPFYVEPKGRGRLDLRLLGGAMPSTGPLAQAGREWDAAGPIAAALASARPRADVLALESVPLGSRWPVALRERWPGPLKPPLRQYYVQSSPTVSLAAGSFDAWLAGKSSNFRGQMRRLRRRFAQAGGTVRAATAATLHADVATLMRLHAARWDGLGASAIVAKAAGFTALFEQLGTTGLAGGRLRLYVLELDGEPISAQLFAAAGGEALHVNGGWDERHAQLKPSLLGIVAGIEDAFERGDQRVDLGPGDQSYKQRLADGDAPVAWTLLIVPQPQMPLTLARVAPTIARIRARDALKRALPPERLQQARELRRRLRR
jgi:CelD/BcsL family acetyltransferase involved in cellulose biosynthesis